MGCGCCKTTIGIEPLSVKYSSNAEQLGNIITVKRPLQLNEGSLELGCQSEEVNGAHVHGLNNKTDQQNGFTSSGYSSASKTTEFDMPECEHSPFLSQSQSEYNHRGTIQEFQPNSEEFLSNNGGETQMYRNNDDNIEGPLEENSLKYDEKFKITRNFRYLKTELDPEFLLDYFLQEDILTDDQAEAVKLAGPRRNQVDLFLRILLRSRNSNAYSSFLNILTETKCSHIRNTLESGNTEVHFLESGSANTKMTKAILKKCRTKLVTNLNDPTSIAEYFVQHQEFSLDEYELILQEKSRKLQAEKLLETVLQSCNVQRRYAILKHALTELGYIDLNDLDNTEEKYENTDVKQIAVMGNFYDSQPNRDELASSSSASEETDEMHITVNIVVDKKKKKRRKEKQVVGKANKYKIKLSVNDALVSETELLLTNIEMGSIVIRLKGCRKGAIKRLLDTGTEEGVLKILRILFSHPDISKSFHEDTIFQVTVDLLPAQQSEIEDKSITQKEIISSNFEFLTEELDALRFLDLDIFTENEKEAILQARPISRATCTKRLLEFALSKSESELELFIESIRQRKRFVWDHICSTECKASLDDDVLSTCYKEFVENLSPSVIIRYCVERGILQKSILYHESYITMQREQCAKLVLHEILQKDYRDRNDFLHIVQAFNQTPIQISLKPKEAEKNPEHQARTFTEKSIVLGICFMTTSEKTEMQGDISKIKDDKSDEESGYQSKSIKRRSQQPTGQDIIQSNSKEQPKNGDELMKSEITMSSESMLHERGSNVFLPKTSEKLFDERLGDDKKQLLTGMKPKPQAETPSKLSGKKYPELLDPELMPRTGPRCFPLFCFNDGNFKIEPLPPITPVQHKKNRAPATKHKKNKTSPVQEKKNKIFFIWDH